MWSPGLARLIRKSSNLSARLSLAARMGEANRDRYAANDLEEYEKHLKE